MCRHKCDKGYYGTDHKKYEEYESEGFVGEKLGNEQLSKPINKMSRSKMGKKTAKTLKILSS